MRGVVAAPKQVITGAFNVRFTFQRELDFKREDVLVETLAGDALGHKKDSFGGSGKSYHLLCYIPDERQGKSRISVVKDGVNVRPVEIAYDTVRVIQPTWGTPFERNGKIEIPLTFPVPIVNLRKRNFRVSVAGRQLVYGAGTDYAIVISTAAQTFSVLVAGTVQKSNGLEAVIEATTLEVARGTFG